MQKPLSCKWECVFVKIILYNSVFNHVPPIVDIVQFVLIRTSNYNFPPTYIMLAIDIGYWSRNPVAAFVFTERHYTTWLDEPLIKRGIDVLFPFADFYAMTVTAKETLRSYWFCLQSNALSHFHIIWWYFIYSQSNCIS